MEIQDISLGGSTTAHEAQLVTSEVASQLLFMRSRTSVRNYIARGELKAASAEPRRKVYVHIQELYDFAVSHGKPTERILAYAQRHNIELTKAQRPL